MISRGGGSHDICEDILHPLCDGTLFHGGTETNIIFAIASQKYGTTAYFPAPSDVKHTFLFSFFFGWHTHTPHTHTRTTYEYTQSLSASLFSLAPRDYKNIRPAVEGARDGECVKERVVGKESTDFNSQNSSGRPPGMEG